MANMFRLCCLSVLSFIILGITFPIRAQEGERTSGKITEDFDGSFGISYGVVIPLGSFASADDTINSGFAKGGGAFNADISFYRPGRRLGLNVRYSFLDLDFNSEELFQTWSILSPQVTFEPRSSAWEIHAPSASLVYRIPLLQDNGALTIGGGLGLHRFTRPKVLVNYREYYTWGEVPWSWVQEEISGVVLSFNALCRFSYKLSPRIGADLLADFQFSQLDVKVRNEFETLYLQDVVYYRNWYVQHAIQFVHLRAGLHYAF